MEHVLGCNCVNCLLRAYARGTTMRNYEPTFLYGKPSDMGHIPMPKPLEVRIAEDIEVLTTGLTLGTKIMHKNGVELPEPERDLSSYRDAYELAVRNCSHGPAQWVDENHVYCPLCDQHLTIAQLENAQMKAHERNCKKHGSH